jgi:hypothetical protein
MIYSLFFPIVSWDTSSVPVVIARKRNHWFIANVPVGTFNLVLWVMTQILNWVMTETGHDTDRS